MTDGSIAWLVVVTREAMEDVAAPPELMDRLMEYCALSGKVASYKLEQGRAGSEATVWVQTDDVLEWKALSSERDSVGDVRKGQS